MKLPCPTPRHALCMAAIALALPWSAPMAATPAEVLAGYVAQAGGPASAARGEQFFTTAGKGDFNWSCASCHTSNPTRGGRHELTEKRISALAPAANAARFTDAKQVEGWFKTNCKDVHRRECTAQEKADVLAWLLTLKP